MYTIYHVKLTMREYSILYSLFAYNIFSYKHRTSNYFAYNHSVSNYIIVYVKYIMVYVKYVIVYVKYVIV